MTFDYHLTHDKTSKDVIPFQGYNYGNPDYYALIIVEGLQDLEIWTFWKAFNNKESQTRLNNNACVFARLRKHEKVVVCK